MECEDCPQDCPLDKSVQLTKIVQGKLSKALVCAECPKRDPLAILPAASGGAFSLQEFLAGIKPAAEAPEPPAPELPEVPDCPACGLSFLEFRQTGRLGCFRDYEVFKPALLPLIAKIQHATTHEGQIPKRAAARLEREARVKVLQHELGEAVLGENYEHAAELRDQIKALASPAAGDAPARAGSEASP